MSSSTRGIDSIVHRVEVGGRRKTKTWVTASGSTYMIYEEAERGRFQCQEANGVTREFSEAR